MRAVSKRRTRSPSAFRQKGVAVLLTLLLVLGVGIALTTSSATRSVTIQLRAERRVQSVLAEVKQALVGRAVADDDRPGSLPCPDALTNIPGVNVPDDGIADVLVGSNCPSYIGRLPWRTLGLTDFRDEHGERLWYALSPNFRDHASAQPLNSDTKGNRVVYAHNTSQTLEAQAVAVIFAPGGPVGNQLRDNTIVACPSMGVPVPRSQCADNYLEASATVNNASGTGPYIAAQRNARFNDRVAVLTTANLMPLVEMRVASELRDVLINYRIESSCGCYPWAALALGVSVPGLNRGRVPGSSALPEAWGSGTTEPLPVWFDANRWGDVIYYSVGKTSLANAGSLCTTCVAPTLSIDGIAGNSALFITTGPAGASRPSLLWPDYLEDGANSDNLNDSYVTPASAAATRDRLYAMPGASPLQCASNAALLLENAPCELKKLKGQGKKKKGIKAACTLFAQNLQVCGCAAAANALVVKPCVKKLTDKKDKTGTKTGTCQAAVATLKACTL